MHGESAGVALIARTAFAATAAAPGDARAFVRTTLRAWDLLTVVDNAELVSSELVTNALRAMVPEPATGRLAGPAPTVVGVELRACAWALRVAVEDDSTDRPASRTPDDDAEGGRGLLLVEALSSRWGVTAVYGGAKVVWADIPLHGCAGAPPG
ncbi:ATP-binding protein [Actinacidiphila acididurans]|uniref:ATP-binding protein n=1 Tax=Actinacidiphila acididurans TaxID=2784346 RepID=A0ABS2TUB1_9ACTN|nr:ATP-binding protein [Actinacidiphila acididurans]MBM9506916.1 ATP-binding protein [Actinacidiphila acididurans]